MRYGVASLLRPNEAEFKGFDCLALIAAGGVAANGGQRFPGQHLTTRLQPRTVTQRSTLPWSLLLSSNESQSPSFAL